MDPDKKHKLILGITALASLVMSIYSFANCLHAQNILKKNVDKYQSVIDNWGAQPLTAVKVVPKGSKCPAGFVEGEPYANKKHRWTEAKSAAQALQTVAVWPGTKTYCECDTPGYNDREWKYTYSKITGCTGGTKPLKTGSGKNEKTEQVKCTSSSQCSSKQIRAGCRHKWQEGVAKTVTYETEAGTCKTNATKAGCRTDIGKPEKALNVFKGYLVCYKRGGLSALKRPKAAEDQSCPSGSYLCGKTKESGTYCAKNKEECPVTNIYLSTNKSDAKMETERPIVEVRMTMNGMCEEGKEGINTRVAYKRSAYNADKHCIGEGDKSMPDPRYVDVAEVDEQTLFNQNNLPAMGNQELPPTKSPLTIRPAGRTPIVTYASKAKQTTYKWKFQFRRELPWNANCTAGKVQDLAKYTDPVKELLDAQTLLTVLNGIFGLGILGIVFPITVIMFIFDKDSDLPCIPGSGEEEEKNIKKYKTVCGLIAKAAKFTPLFLAYTLSGSMKAFFWGVGAAKCSDDTTNGVFDYLGMKITQVNEANRNTLICDVLQAVFTLLSALYTVYKDRKKKSQEGAQELTDLKEVGGNAPPKNSWHPAQQTLQQDQQRAMMEQQQQAMLLQQQQFQTNQANLRAQGFQDLDGDGVITEVEVNAQIQAQYNAQMQAQQAAVEAPSDAPPSSEITITVPQGYGPGKLLTIKTASGKSVKLKIPEGKLPGMNFTVDMAVLEAMAK